MNLSRRFLGLELSGAKNKKTALAALEYYPREQKIFLLDIYDKISGHDDQTGDEALLEIIEEEKPTAECLAVNIPLTLPPCVTCTRRTCPLPGKCTVPAVRFMRETVRRAKTQEITPYTQRPVELHIRHTVLPALDKSSHFDVDEALGGTKAPLTVRMHFLMKHLDGLEIIEAWPKLTVASLAKKLGLSKQVIESHRDIEKGVKAREEILDALVHGPGIFIYDRDMQKLARSLTAFDAFICAYTALLTHTDSYVKPPRGFPASTGWVEYPNV
jgi:hypothetical protein